MRVLLSLASLFVEEVVQSVVPGGSVLRGAGASMRAQERAVLGTGDVSIEARVGCGRTVSIGDGRKVEAVIQKVRICTGAGEEAAVDGASISHPSWAGNVECSPAQRRRIRRNGDGDVRWGTNSRSGGRERASVAGWTKKRRRN